MDNFNFDESAAALKRALEIFKSLVEGSEDIDDRLGTIPHLFDDGISKGTILPVTQPSGDLPGVFRTTYD